MSCLSMSVRPLIECTLTHDSGYGRQNKNLNGCGMVQEGTVALMG
jgi:hypothetical protein